MLFSYIATLDLKRTMSELGKPFLKKSDAASEQKSTSEKLKFSSNNKNRIDPVNV